MRRIYMRASAQLRSNFPPRRGDPARRKSRARVAGKRRERELIKRTGEGEKGCETPHFSATAAGPGTRARELRN